MVTGSRTSLLASSEFVKTGRPFMCVWVPSYLMIRISASMLRSRVSCISSATTVCPVLGISSQNSSREFCGWYPVKNMISGPISKTHLLSMPLYLIFFIPLATEPPKGSRARRDVTMPSWITSHGAFCWLWCKLSGSMQRNAREPYAFHAARTAFQISGALLSLMQSFPSLN